MKRLVLTTVLILATLGGLILLWQFREALLLFALSLAIAAAARPAVEAWEARGVSRGLAILATYLIGIAVLGLLIFFISGPVLEELELGSNNLSVFYERVVQTWPDGTAFQQSVARQLPPPEELYAAFAGEQGATLARNVLGVAQGFFSGLSQFAIALVISIYWSIDRVRFERLWLSILPSRQRTRARDIWQAIEKGVGAYVRSEVIQSLLAGLLLWVGYSMMGLRYPALLALTGSLLWLIPWLGAVLAVILPVLVGLQDGWLLAAAAALFTLLVLLVLEVVVEPRFFNRRRYSSLLVVIVVVAMAEAYGLVGLIIGPPLAAAIQILFSRLFRGLSPAETVSPTSQVANLRNRLEQVQAEAAGMDGETPPEIVSLMARLDSLLVESNQVLQNTADEVPSLGLPTRTTTSG